MRVQPDIEQESVKQSTPTEEVLRVDTPWSTGCQELLKNLEVEPQVGLNADTIIERRTIFGPNVLLEAKARSRISILIAQFKSLLVALLLVGAALSFLFGDFIEGFAILAVVLINALIGYVTEFKALRSMETLKQLSDIEVVVRRNGQIQEIPAEELVPGDIVLVEGGDVITADMRVLEASKLKADESTFTGESLPVSKRPTPVQEKAPLAERSSMLFKGSSVTRGSGEAVVLSIGMGTELGKISSLTQQAEPEQTPLERRLTHLGHYLVWITCGIVVVIAALNLYLGRELIFTIEVAIALAVATVPEGLPIVATLALARGMWRMARKNAIIERLSAVETLGSTNVILCDKTGTLTENRMTVTHLALNGGIIEIPREKESAQSFLHQMLPGASSNLLTQTLETVVLCNNASIARGVNRAVGDPMEVALLIVGDKFDMQRDALRRRLPELREVAFEPETKMMATYHEMEKDQRYRVAVKGAPESVLASCTHLRVDGELQEFSDTELAEWMALNDEMASRGLRILAVATKEVCELKEDPYQSLVLLGLIGLLDPPRQDAREAIQTCRKAGIQVSMVTGDQAATAQNIAYEVGLSDDPKQAAILGQEIRELSQLSLEEVDRLLRAHVIARSSPEEKLRLITLHQRNGSIVGMTGDGVNDAPALKKADIGIAMGERGTQVAKDAAHMVLLDDKFSTIVAAIEEGRIIFNNIRKFIFYLLSCNMSEILLVGLAPLFGLPLPLLPLQILYLNLVTDVFPALALGAGGGSPDIIQQPARDPREGLLTRAHWRGICAYGLTITVVVFAALVVSLYYLEMTQAEAISISFLTLAASQLWHVFNMSDLSSPMLKNEVTKNPWIWVAIALCLGLLLAAVYLPVLSLVLKLEDPGETGWWLIFGLSLCPLLVGQIYKLMQGTGPSVP